MELNVRCSSKYRRYAGTILPFLRDRPHDVIQHVMCRYADGKRFPPEKVAQTADGSFEVVSASHTDVTYRVIFDDDGMPSCDCYDWQRFHLPCKHFCAVFHLYPDHGWGTNQHVFVFLSYLAVLWDNSRYDTWLFPKVSNEQVLCSAISFLVPKSPCL